MQASTGACTIGIMFLSQQGAVMISMLELNLNLTGGNRVDYHLEKGIELMKIWGIIN